MPPLASLSRATFEPDFDFHARDLSLRVYRVAAEDADPADRSVRPLVWCRNREATAAAEWLMLIVALYRCERALA